MKVAFHEEYVHPLPENHRFPMEKYDLLPKQLIYEGTCLKEDFITPELIEDRRLLSVHSAHYLRDLEELKISPKAQRVSGFVHSDLLIKREKRIMEGTRLCAEYALHEKVAFNIAGGTHHAYADRGEGFCLLNDQAIASKWLMHEKEVNKILIIDLDVHQGNGTAKIFENDPNVFTFSMHGKNNYPLKKELSDLDIELEDGTGDRDYLYLLESSLHSILKDFDPDFVFYQCGVDIIDTDKLGKLKVSKEGARKRDILVFDTVKQLDVPVVCSMGGGYSPKIADIVDAHANTFRMAQTILC
jgi:acetoin utilization deacetylase AcuC-like enzyme